MDKFFLHLLNKIEILTGIRQLERLQDKPEQLAELIAECSKAANQFPLKDEIVKAVLMDAVSSDQDFIGLNVKWVRKILNLYCQVHGVNKQNEKEEVVDLPLQYGNLAQFWHDREDLDPIGTHFANALENLKRVRAGQPPVDDLEGIKILAGMYSKQIEGTILAQPTEPKRGGSKLREHMECLPTEPSKPEEMPKHENNNPVKSFLVEGIEVFASTQEEANNIFYGTTSNEKGSEGTGEAPGISDDKSNTPEQNNSV